jgi:hypothetical protein
LNFFKKRKRKKENRREKASEWLKKVGAESGARRWEKGENRPSPWLYHWENARVSSSWFVCTPTASAGEWM